MTGVTLKREMGMIRGVLVAAVSLISIGWADAALAQDRWVLIATEELDPNQTTGAIDTSKAKGSVRALRIQARRNNVDISRIEVSYAGGGNHVIDRRFSLEPGERTKPIDEKDAERFVDRVSVAYSVPKKGKRKPILDIYALQSPKGRLAKRDPNLDIAKAGTQTGQIETSATNSQPLPIEAGAIIEGRDVMFGYQNVGYGIDKDRIAVGSDVGKFEYLRLRVLDNAVHINQLVVNYVNGTSQTLVVDADVGANQKTKWFRVNGKEFIKDIEMSYRSRPNFKGQARVEVIGQFANNWLGPGGEGRQYNEGWVLLGSQTAGSLGYDTDTVSVGANEGGFTRVRLNVRDRSITLREVRVVFASGPDEVIKLNDRIDPGQSAGPWDLKGEHSPIKEIKVTYRTRILFGKGVGAGVVEFWGQH
jgi:hypothetical protein